tara:strand:- start:361 stop:531 length:171 start_codon:yes stop_codon:yes gene_type:complete
MIGPFFVGFELRDDRGGVADRWADTGCDQQGGGEESGYGGGYAVRHVGDHFGFPSF